MTKTIIIGITVIGLLVAAAYYVFLYPPFQYERKAQYMLNAIDMAVASQDRAKIGQILEQDISDNADIELEVDFPTPPGQKTKEESRQKFTKTQFLSFVDNELYSTRNYLSKSRVESLSLDNDRKAGTLIFSSLEQADDISALGNTRFSGDTECTAHVLLGENPLFKFDTLSCVVKLHYGFADNKSGM